MSDVATRIKELREKEGLTQQQLADKIETSRGTVINWEKGTRKPDSEKISLMSDIFKVSSDFLLCREKDLSLRSGNGENRIVFLNPGHMIEIPVLSEAVLVCCSHDEHPQMEATETVVIEKSCVDGVVDGRSLFAVKLPRGDDSMEEAGISPGATVVISTEEPVASGDIALVRYDGRLLVRGILYLPDGSVELRASGNEYGPISVPSHAIEDPRWFFIHGKVKLSVTSNTPKPFI